ncbi:Hint domain-containing protein [Methylobacterium sp. NEAU 140]|uniref:Hint domain-containing protein n=1 Tax=Methylobacterium sp. NEAU 140 TaxID=3064945 RepID=UPI0027369622|nr:Hint domain-containing protein [Methylobacterium sp. NEAU 140]MDP4026848.1 Hint domain-containing protein [Methylobacterium sp. NEAU 140]
MSTISFDNTSGSGTGGQAIPNGYGGFNWTNFNALDGTQNAFQGTGYRNGIVSSPNVAFNAAGLSGSFSSTSSFTLNDFYATSAFQNPASIQVTGSLNGVQVYNTTITPNSQAPTLYSFNWTGINQVTIAPNTPGQGQQFVIDNLRVNEAVPVQPAAPCYVTGTRIRALRGRTLQDVPVETLRVGDLALTASGKPRPIRWIGTRSYPGLTAPKHDRPVRVRAGALADGVPARDLRVSPDHCLFLDGLLVAAGHLVNGTSITRGEAVADLTYWHVELDSHDMLMAENIPAESFLAAPGVRAGFDGTHRLNVHETPVPYAERVEHGPELAALRSRLIVRAGLSVEPVRHGAMRAWFDRCDGRRLVGWVQDLAHPNGRVCLDVVVDGTVVALTMAEAYRADIAAAGVGDGCHGFDFDLDEPLAPGMVHTVELRRSADGVVVCAMAVDAAGAWTPLLAA